jgi:hypothetical protein
MLSIRLQLGTFKQATDSVVNDRQISRSAITRQAGGQRPEGAGWEALAAAASLFGLPRGTGMNNKPSSGTAMI